MIIETAALVDRIALLVQPWADLYAESANLSTGILATHLLGLFVGGGMAISADRTILRAKPGTSDGVRAVVADLSTTHSVVIGALVVTVSTGLSMLASDVATFAVSRVFWIKMAVFATLLLNGLRLQRVEKQVLLSVGSSMVTPDEAPPPFPTKEWRGIRTSAGTSFVLWMSLVVLGVVLSNG